MSLNPHPPSGFLGGFQNAVSGGINHLTNTVGGTSHAIQEGGGHVVDQIVHGPGKFIDKETHDIGHALGDAQKTITNSILGESNSLQKNVLPYVLIGGAALLLIMIVLRK